MNQNITFLNNISLSIEQITWPYMCSTTVIKITHHWSLFLELRGNNCIYTRSGYPLICKYWRDVGLCSVWNLILLVNSPSNMKFTIIWTLLHSSVLPLHFLGNRAFEKIWSLKSGSKKEYLYRHTHLDSLPSSSNNTIAVKSTNPTATATGAYAANVVRHCLHNRPRRSTWVLIWSKSSIIIKCCPVVIDQWSLPRSLIFL